MITGQPWIPIDCLRSSRTAQPVITVITDWSKDWFGKAGWTPGANFTNEKANDWSEIRRDERVSILGRPKAALDLAMAILGVKVGRDPSIDRDLRFLRLLANNALDDLLARISEVMPGGQSLSAYSAPNNQMWRLAINPPGGSAVAVEVEKADLVEFARRTYKPIAPIAPLSKPNTSIKGLGVPIAGLIGTASLAIGEIDRLEEGDVIVLDQLADKPVRLIVDGRATDLPFAIGETDNKITLSLQDI